MSPGTYCALPELRALTLADYAEEIVRSGFGGEQGCRVGVRAGRGYSVREILPIEAVAVAMQAVYASRGALPMRW